MAQIFQRYANTLARVTIFGAVFVAGFVLWVIGGVVRSPYATDQGIEREQPVPFSHQHHVSGMGLGCALQRGAEMVASGVIAHLMPRASQPRATTSPAALVPGWRRTLMLPSASLSPEHPG